MKECSNDQMKLAEGSHFYFSAPLPRVVEVRALLERHYSLVKITFAKWG